MHTHIHTYIHTHTRTYIHRWNKTVASGAHHAYTYSYIHTHAHIHTQVEQDRDQIWHLVHIMHTHIHTYIHTHTHTYTGGARPRSDMASGHRSVQGTSKSTHHAYTYTYTRTHTQIHTQVEQDRDQIWHLVIDQCKELQQVHKTGLRDPLRNMIIDITSRALASSSYSHVIPKTQTQTIFDISKTISSSQSVRLTTHTLTRPADNHLASQCLHSTHAWKQFISHTTGRPFWYHKYTKETRWSDPYLDLKPLQQDTRTSAHLDSSVNVGFLQQSTPSKSDSDPAHAGSVQKAAARQQMQKATQGNAMLAPLHTGTSGPVYAQRVSDRGPQQAQEVAHGIAIMTLQDLASDWVSRLSTRKGVIYYQHTITGQTSWTAPALTDTRGKEQRWIPPRNPYTKRTTHVDRTSAASVVVSSAAGQNVADSVSVVMSTARLGPGEMRAGMSTYSNATVQNVAESKGTAVNASALNATVRNAAALNPSTVNAINTTALHATAANVAEDHVNAKNAARDARVRSCSFKPIPNRVPCRPDTEVGERGSVACLAKSHPLYSGVVHRCVLCVLVCVCVCT
jgi:hypothetical protein